MNANHFTVIYIVNHICNCKTEVSKFLDLLTNISDSSWIHNTHLFHSKANVKEQSGVNAGPGFVPNPGTLLKAVQPHSPSYFDELNVSVGDRITFLDQIEPGWWRGKSNSRVRTKS